MHTENKSKTGRVVFVGESGFPVGLATIQRMTLMARAFLHVGCQTTVVCRKGVQPQNQGIDFPKKGNFEGVDYVYTSNSIYKSNSFLQRNREKLMGMLGEFKFLKKHKEQEGIDLVIVSDMKVVHVLRYYLYSAILKIPIATNFVEMASSMQHRTSTAIRINDYILDKWCIKLFDGALPISDRLMAYYAAVAPTKPRLKLPILCDFKKFDIPATKKEPYFLYCGSFRFKEVRDFIIQAYKLVANDEKTKLYMIISGGSKSETALLEQELNSHFKSRPIKLFANIPYAQLVQLNTNALALLIPLRPTVQDASRFPHKIGEYLASGNPVITTNIGEVRTYFEDGNTALVADNYSIESFAEKMKYVQENPERAASIGSNGRALGLKEFDFRTHGEPLKKFLREIT